MSCLALPCFALLCLALLCFALPCLSFIHLFVVLCVVVFVLLLFLLLVLLFFARCLPGLWSPFFRVRRSVCRASGGCAAAARAVGRGAGGLGGEQGA
jgi:hypothetical protein